MSARPTIPEKDKIAYTIYEAAQACGVSDTTVRRAIGCGDLIAYYPTARAVILKEELQAWIRASPSERRSA